MGGVQIWVLGMGIAWPCGVGILGGAFNLFIFLVGCITCGVLPVPGQCLIYYW